MFYIFRSFTLPIVKSRSRKEPHVFEPEPLGKKIRIGSRLKKINMSRSREKIIRLLSPGCGYIKEITYIIMQFLLVISIDTDYSLLKIGSLNFLAQKIENLSVFLSGQWVYKYHFNIKLSIVLLLRRFKA